MESSASPESMEEGEDAPVVCFVCFEEAPPDMLSGICDCTTLRVHRHCLQRWVRTSGRTACGVCKAPYANVVVTYGCALSFEGYIVVALGAEVLLCASVLYALRTVSCNVVCVGFWYLMPTFGTACAILAMELIRRMHLWDRVPRRIVFDQASPA